MVRKTGDVSHFAAAGRLDALARLGAAWAAQEIALWLAGRVDRLEGKLASLSFGRSGTDIETHAVIRRPQCPVCGTPLRSSEAKPIIFQSRPTIDVEDGASRIEHPDATWVRLKHHISPITGTVTWLRDSGHDPEGLLHSFEAGHSIAIGPDNAGWLRKSVLLNAGGKGISAEFRHGQAPCANPSSAIVACSGTIRHA